MSKLVYHEIPEYVYINGEQKRPWWRWQGEMDALVARQAQDLFIETEEMYDMIENMLSVPQTPVALLIDTDAGLLRGFVGCTIAAPNLLVNFCSVQRGVGTEEYAPVFIEYIDKLGMSNGCYQKIFVVNHAIKYSLKDSFKKHDPVTRVCHKLGAEPFAVMYTGAIPTAKQEGD